VRTLAAGPGADEAIIGWQAHRRQLFNGGLGLGDIAAVASGLLATIDKGKLAPRFYEPLKDRYGEP
jgi:hypothetical protein